MRWHRGTFPKLYSKRVRTKFLWLPLCIGGEVRWLETASFIECYLGLGPSGWFPVHWGTL